MKHCAEHWKAMKAAVETRGMGHLGARNSDELIAQTTRALEAGLAGKEPDHKEFDPLISMNWAFCHRATEQMGLGIMMEKDAEAVEFEKDYDVPANDGHYCPLCCAKIAFLRHARGAGGRCGEPTCQIVVAPGDKPYDEQWIEDCADAMLVKAREYGLVTVQ